MSEQTSESQEVITIVFCNDWSFVAPTRQCRFCLASQDYHVEGKVADYTLVLVEDHKEECPRYSHKGVTHEVEF